MAAGIPACSSSVRLKPAFFCRRAGGVRLEKVAGVEIIPLEPDQRSDLRREAPQCHTYLLSLLPLWGLGQS
jgi:hypothetical protein